MESGQRFQVKIHANNVNPRETCVVYAFPIARPASLAIITPAVVVNPIAVPTVAAGMPPVTVIVLYPPFCIVWAACVVWIIGFDCTVCVAAGVLIGMNVGVTVTPFP
jgi:hypothetical protein